MSSDLIGIRVDLEPFEVEWAYTVGLRRDAANLAKVDAQHYDKNRMQDNIVASVAAAACELAVAKATNRYWSGSVWDSSLHHKYRMDPDVQPNIEVRRTRVLGNPLVVRRRDVQAGHVIVSAYAHEDESFRAVTVVGWLPAAHAWEVGSPAPYDPEGTRTVSTEFLHPLINLVAKGVPIA